MPAQMPNAKPPARGAVTVRRLAPELKARLRMRAAPNARSMKAEARAIIEARPRNCRWWPTAAACAVRRE
jgi:plasmid stability protein